MNRFKKVIEFRKVIDPALILFAVVVLWFAWRELLR